MSITNFRSLLKLMSIESVMPSKHLILCCPLLLPSIFPSIRVFSNESVCHIRWPKCLSFSFSFSPSNEYSEQIFFRSHHCLLNFQFIHWFIISVWIQFTITVFIQWVLWFFGGQGGVPHGLQDLSPQAMAVKTLNPNHWITKELSFCCCYCSVAKSCQLYNSMDWRMPGSSDVLHYLPEFAQIHVHWVDDEV